MKRFAWIGAVVALLVATAALEPAAEGSKKPVPYPDSYRDWTHVKSMVIQAGHPLYDAFGGIHHV